MLHRWKKPGSLFITPPARPARRRRKILFGVPAFLWTGFRRTALFIGSLFLILMMVSCVGAVFVGNYETPLPERMVLNLRLNTGLSEYSPDADFLRELYGPAFGRLNTQDMIDAIDRAAHDKRVVGVIVTIESGPFDLTQVQDLRQAIKRFRAAGKTANAYSPSFAEAGMGAYYLAASFDNIWMQPVGMVAIPGFDAQMPFFRDGLGKVGVTPHVYQRKEYKGVMENLSRSSLSDPGREMLSSLLGDLMAQMNTDISADRQIDFRALVDRGLFLDEEAREAGLIDRIGYFDEVRQAAVGRSAARIVSLSRYRGQTVARDKQHGKTKVGIVYAQGAIVADDRSSSFGGGSDVAAANRISEAIIRTVRDDTVEAIILRINSPGGSPTASETIRRAVAYAVKRDLPVIVSMGPAAGSGGYWIATDATHIFALPATLTGSIGVASGKMDFAEMMTKIGVNWDGVTLGANADLWSFTRPFSPSGDRLMNNMADALYDAFIDRVATGRKLDREQVEAIARGRVWTGQQAKANGLVDDLGGLSDALDHTARMLGLADRHDLTLSHLPRPKTPFDRFLELINVEVMMDRIAHAAMKRMEQAAMPKVMAHDPLLEIRL